MSTLNLFFLCKWLPLTLELSSRLRTRETTTSHNFLVWCRDHSGATGTKQRMKGLPHSWGGTSLSPPLRCVHGERRLSTVSVYQPQETPSDYEPASVVAFLPFPMSSLQISVCSFSQKRFLLNFDPGSVVWVSPERSLASSLPLWKCLFHIWNVFMCIRSALTCRRRKKGVLLEAKQPPVKTNCVGRGLMVSLRGIQQEESKCSKSTRKSPGCQADPLHQRQDWNSPSDRGPVFRRRGGESGKREEPRERRRSSSGWTV